MTRTLRTTITMALGLAAGSAGAQDAGGFYAEAFGGLSRLSGTDLSFADGALATDFDTGVVAGGAVGYRPPESPLRGELEFTYRSAEGQDAGGDFASTTLALNGYYDLGIPGARLRPYLGAGIGYVTEIDYDVASGALAGEYNDRGGVLGQVMLGVGYEVTSRFTLSGELRYFDGGGRTLEAEDGRKIEADYSGAELTVGLAYRF